MRVGSVISLVSVTAVLALALALAHQTRLRLTEEHRALAQQLDQMAALSARNQ